MAMMKGKTPFMKAEDRLMEAFASEMEALGLKAHTSLCYSLVVAFSVYQHIRDTRTGGPPQNYPR